jgi:hypothetical protein
MNVKREKNKRIYELSTMVVIIVILVFIFIKFLYF